METQEVEEEVKSEFGKGLVVCLAKFSQHLNGYMADNVVHCHSWMEMRPEKREAVDKEAQEYPRGDASRFMSSVSLAQISKNVRGSWEQAMSSAIEMWANGASDHFYDLDDKAPESLQELASITLKMGHGFTDTVWSWQDWLKVWELWEKSCMEVDKMLGIEGDFGRYRNDSLRQFN